MKRPVKIAAALAAAAAVVALSVGIATATTTTEVSFGPVKLVSQTNGPDADSTTSHTYVNVPGGFHGEALDLGQERAGSTNRRLAAWPSAPRC